MLVGAGFSLLVPGMMGFSGPSSMTLASRRSLSIFWRMASGVAPARKGGAGLVDRWERGWEEGIGEVR